MDTIQIRRAAAAVDEYDNPIPGAYADHGEPMLVLFAPSNPEEPNDLGRNAVITSGVVYIRTEKNLDIRSTDQASLRGTIWDIDGEVGDWNGYSGRKGIQFALKRSDG